MRKSSTEFLISAIDWAPHPFDLMSPSSWSISSGGKVFIYCINVSAISINKY